MKKLSKNVLLIFVFTSPFIVFAQPSEYVKDVKTKAVIPAEQKKIEKPVQKSPIIFETQIPIEVTIKGVTELAPPQYIQPNTPNIEAKAAVLTEEPVEEVLAIMHFEKKAVDFGQVKMGEHPSHIFRYTNMGQEPTEIEIVSACDCTEVEYSRTPLAVGATTYIKATYMSERAPENVNKTFEKEITIILKNKYPDTGYPMVETLKIKGNVVE
jgi:Protein of unknown function (DUF1573)